MDSPLPGEVEAASLLEYFTVANYEQEESIVGISAGCTHIHCLVSLITKLSCFCWMTTIDILITGRNIKSLSGV